MAIEAGRDAPGAPATPARSALVPLHRGAASIVHLKDSWFVAAPSRELGHRPLATMLFGMPIVLFRDATGRAGALLDRCPHRNVPLSLGRVAEDGRLTCAYHGWRFDVEGACTLIPSLTNGSEAKARRAHMFPTVEQQGFVWVYSTPSQGVEVPRTAPHRFAYLDAKGYCTVTQVVDVEGTLYSTLENALDVPHTAFLHRGLFRSESRGIAITAKVHRAGDRVTAEYVGEPRPAGIMARVLSPSGGIVTHFDRFLLPSIAQVEYSIGPENHVLVDSVMTPLTDFRTRIYAVVSFRTRLPHVLVQPFVKPLAMRVFRQDAFILKKQTESIQRFGGEQFASTEIDVLGRHIWRLLKAAERGDFHATEETAEVHLIV
jgi:phenylpropionate dioxygenase-like ring-hydroxylating dioxygenase large terminal subunit